MVDALCAILDEELPPGENPALTAGGSPPTPRSRASCPTGPATTAATRSTPRRSATELGWEPHHAFEDGLRATVRWYLAHRDWCTAVQSGTYGRERLGLEG